MSFANEEIELMSVLNKKRCKEGVRGMPREPT